MDGDRDRPFARLAASVVGATIYLGRDHTYAATIASVDGRGERPVGRIVYQFPAAGSKVQCRSTSHDSATCCYGRCGLHDSARDLAVRMLLDYWHDHPTVAPDRAQRVHVAGNKALVYRRRSDDEFVSLSVFHNDQVLSGQTELAESEVPARSVPTRRRLGAHARRSGLDVDAEAADHSLPLNQGAQIVLGADGRVRLRCAADKRTRGATLRTGRHRSSRSSDGNSSDSARGSDSELDDEGSTRTGVLPVPVPPPLPSSSVPRARDHEPFVSVLGQKRRNGGGGAVVPQRGTWRTEERHDRSDGADTDTDVGPGPASDGHGPARPAKRVKAATAAGAPPTAATPVVAPAAVRPLVALRDRVVDRLFHGDNVTVLRREDRILADGVITSPPFNLGRNPHHRSGPHASSLYGPSFTDDKPRTQYIDDLVALFRLLELRVVPHGAVVVNLSYGARDPSLPEETVVELQRRTDYVVVDKIAWKKPRAMPFQASATRLARIWEALYVFCRRGCLAAQPDRSNTD